MGEPRGEPEPDSFPSLLKKKISPSRGMVSSYLGEINVFL